VSTYTADGRLIVRQAEDGARLSAVRILTDPVALGLQIEQAGRDPDVVLEATYGWYWAADVLQAAGARVHLAHPLGVGALPGQARRFALRTQGPGAGAVTLSGA